MSDNIPGRWPLSDPDPAAPTAIENSVHSPMRKPALNRGAALQKEIGETVVPFGQAAIWWLGQATFCFKLGQSLIYTDPFYRAEDQEPPTPLQELPLKPGEFTGASLICCTHEHLDHIDPLTLPGAAAASPQASVIIPESTRDLVLGMNVPAERLVTMRGDDKIERGAITIHAIPAAHMTLDKNAHGYRYLGYMIQGNGVTLYHPGDTQPYPGWAARVSKFEIDIAFLPISGVDNLHWQQAIYFCANHQPRLAIPMHYGLFPKYTQDPLVFANGLSNNVPDQKIKIMQVGEKFIYQR